MKRSLKEFERRSKRAGKGKGKDKELRVSGSEPEARRMKLADGSYGSAYNVQISTECKSTMIVGIEAVQEVNDTHQLAPAIRRVEKQAGAKRFRMLADGGHATRENVEYASRKKVVLYAPWKGEEARESGVLGRNGIAPEYGPAAFVAERGGDALVCPTGKLLANQGTARRHRHWKVIYEARAGDCQACPRQRCRGQEAGWGKGGRVVESEAMKQYLARMESERRAAAYKERSRLGEFAG
jgi:hypothetical protein